MTEGGTIRKAMLVVGHPDFLFLKAGGLTVIERQLWTVAQAGFHKVWIGMPRPEESRLSRCRLPPGLGIFWSGSQEGGGDVCEPPYIGVSADHFLRAADLASLALHPPAALAAYESASDGAVVVQVIPFRSDKAAAYEKHRLPEGAAVSLSLPFEKTGVLDWLCRQGPRENDGYMARHFDRKLSLAITRRLLETPITPNAVTLLSSAVGLAGASFFFHPSRLSGLAGALLIWAHSVIDGCDGEMARIALKTSEFGRRLDFCTDNLVHAAMFGALALGFARQDQSAVPLFLGAMSLAGVAGSAFLSYKKRWDREDAGASLEAPTWKARLEGFGAWLEERDFIYVMVLLAAFGRLYEFLWAGAIGSLLFFGMMLYLKNRPAGESRGVSLPAGEA